MNVRSIIQKAAVIIALAVSLWGCGSGNGGTPNFNTTSGEHSLGWLAGPASHGVKNASNTNIANDCAGCHGPAATLSGGVGPACRTCHTFSPLTNLVCTSCHGNPPNGNPAISAGYPNIQGSHDVHNALNNVTGVCATCHSGGGFGTFNHFNGVVNVDFLGAYTAKTGGAAVYIPDNNGGRCSNVSCHGGITTPPWLTGSINPNSDCTSCHQSRGDSDQYNSFFSGNPVPPTFASMHDFHLQGIGLTCIDCHDTAKLDPDTSNHFKFLNTPAFEGAPSATIRSAVTYVGTVASGVSSCSPVNNGTNFSINFCHGVRTWTGP